MKISNPYLNRFKEDCRNKGMTTHSIETYLSNLKEYLAYFPDPLKIGTDQLRSYLEKLKYRKLSRATIRGYMSAVSSFYDFLVFEKEIQVNPTIGFRKRYIEKMKGSSETRQLLSIENIKDLCKVAQLIQEKAWIMVLAKTGMRRGELHALKETDLDFEKHIIHIPQKAKRSNCIAFMDPELEEILKEYLEWRKTRTKSSFLWISTKGGRIHRDMYGMILADLGGRLHLHCKNGRLETRLTPHCMRHFYTTTLFRAGMNEQYIKFLRGDSMKDESWQIYNRIDPELVKAEYMRCIPKIL